MSKIKVIHVMHDFLFGGIEAFLYYLTQSQQLNPELEISILCCQNKNEISNKRLQSLGIVIHYVKLNSFDLSILKYFRIIKITNEYDIIHIHSFKPILSKFFRFSKSKILYTNHSSGTIGRSNSFSFTLKNKLLVKFQNKIADGVTHNSKYTQIFWQENGLKNTDNWVIYNGVHFEKEINNNRAIEDYPELENKFIIGTTSRFISWKRIDLLIDAFKQIDNKDIILLLVGDGDQKTKLEQKVESLKIENVIFTGHKNKVIDYQSVMDVCVFPSHSEPFGLVAVECLHLGKPVVVFKDGGGITEIIDVIEKENVVADVSQLVILLNFFYQGFKKSIKDEMKPKRIEYSELFNMNKIEKEFYQCYKTLTNTNL